MNAKMIQAAGAAAALLVSAGAPVAAQAGVDDGVYRLGTAAPKLETVQYFWGGRRYCWYPGGWHGPGWYWCGYAWRRGWGWGGGPGWHGWAYRGGPGWHGRGWHDRGWRDRGWRDHDRHWRGDHRDWGRRY